MSQGSVTSPARWRTAAESFIPLSERWGDARIDRAQTRRALRCSDEVLDLLCAHGLPSQEHDGAQTFGQCDVMNVGLTCGEGRTVPELAQRRLLRFAAGVPREWIEPRLWTVVLSLTCECGGDGGEQAWALGRPAPEIYGGEIEASEIHSDDAGHLTATIELRTQGWRGAGEHPVVATAMRELAEEFRLGSLRFHYLPPILRATPREAVRVGAVDCIALTITLADRLQAGGLATSTRRGYLLGGVCSEHAWVESLDPSARLAVDPMLAILSARAPTGNGEFANFCLHSVPNRLLAWERAAERPLFAHLHPGGARPDGERSMPVVALSARVRAAVNDAHPPSADSARVRAPR